MNKLINIPNPSNPKVSYDTKEMTVTIPYITFNAMVGVFDLNNQADLDSLIENLIEEALDYQLMR